MKTEEKRNGHASAAEVGSLLNRCKVGGNAACARAGIVYSTLYRWRRGSSPKDGQLDLLRRAIMEMAHEAGTLPEDLAPTLVELRQRVALPTAAPRDLAARVDRLERAVTEQLGASL